jgi:YfaZ precursor
MRSHVTLLIAAPLLFAASQAVAQRDTRAGSTGELALSNDTLQLRYLGSGNMVGLQGSQFTGGVFLGEERDFVLNAGLLFPADLGIRRLNISFGPQLYAALLQEENDDVMAVSVGTEVRFFIDPDRGFAISGQAYYAPDILTFGTADNLTDLSARVELGVAEQLQAFAGMRWFEFDLTDGSGERTLQEEAFVGVGYRF